MAEAYDVLALLRWSDRRLERAPGRSRRIRFGVLALILLLYGVFLATDIVFLLRAWRGDDWPNFWIAFLPDAQFSVTAARIASLKDGRAHLYAPVARLRAAIRAGDEACAPRVEIPAIPAADSLEVAGATRFGPLRRPPNKAGIALLVLAAVPPVLVLAGMVLLENGYGSLAAVISAVVLVPSILAALWCVWALRSFSVTADEDGLRWRRLSGRRAFLRWHEARAFYRVSGWLRLTNGRETFYMLDGGASILTWREAHSSSTSYEPQGPSLRLARLIVERTGLPLRDASEQVTRLAALPEEGIEETEPLSVKLGLTVSSAERRRRMWLLGRLVAPVLVVAAIGGALQIGQPHYFELLFQRAHAHQPLYMDSLAKPDADWPTSARTSFVGGALLATDDPFKDESQLFVPSPRPADNALYVVTARTGPIAHDNPYAFGGPGLAILGDGGGRNMLVFSIETTESWWWNLDLVSSVNRYQDMPNSGVDIRFGHNHDENIHKGLGAINQIAVLVCGGDFTFYVNGHYVTRYYDTALAGRPIGLTLGGQGETASFTDFAIYPA